MTLGVLLAAAVALTAEGRQAALNTRPAGGTRVASFLHNYNKQCWVDHCDVQLSACVSLEPDCQHHFFCKAEPSGSVLDEGSTEHCFGDARWAELSDRELGVFACAAENNCVTKDHPALSFLQEELRLRPLSSFAETTEGSLDLNEDEGKTVSVVLQLRAMVQAAEDYHARLVMANGMKELKATTARLDKLKSIKSPTTEDVVMMAAMFRRMNMLRGDFDQQLLVAKSRAEVPPMDLAAVAKLSRDKATAPYTAKLAAVLSQMEQASIPATRNSRKAAATKFATDAIAFAKELERQDKGKSKVVVDADGHLRHGR